MKRGLLLLILLTLLAAGWRISERLSTDALGLAIGVLLGILAGVPVALLLLASQRRRDQWTDGASGNPRRQEKLPTHPQSYAMQQPPVIVLAGNGYPSNFGGGQHDGGQQPRQLTAMPAAQPPDPHERKFKVVGEQDEWIEEW